MTGARFKVFLRKNTETPLKGILSGTLVTAFLQSSSLVSLMVLAFVGAGIMSMTNAIGVILGANLGTTLTGWFFALVGFKLKIKSLAFVLLAVGSFVRTLFPENRKLKYISLFIIGFALIFTGLDFMKTSFEGLAEQFNITRYLHFGPYGFFFVGFILTSVIQSSSASMVITLAAINANLLTFETAAGMVVGSDLGTTLTVFLGTINSSGDKKRVALSHFLFNLVTVSVALIFLYPLLTAITSLGIKDPLIGIVIFHSSFNLIGVTLFFNFIPDFSNFLSKRFKQKTESHVFYLNSADPELFPGSADENIIKEVDTYIKRCLKLAIHYLQFESIVKFPEYKEEYSLSSWTGTYV